MPSLQVGQQGAVEVGRASGAECLGNAPTHRGRAGGVGPAHVRRVTGYRAGKREAGRVLAPVERPDGKALIAGRDEFLERLVAKRGDGRGLPLVGGGQGEFIEEQGEVVSGCVVHTRQ